MRWVVVAVLALAGVFGRPAFAQTQIVSGAAVGGVGISTDGVLSMRQVGTVANGATPAAPNAAAAGRKTVGEKGLVYVSLPRALEAWRSARAAGQEPANEIKYLKGMTRIQNVFVYPDEHDIVIAGPSEPLKLDNPLEPVGVVSGRPAVQMEDLVVALRCVTGAPGRGGGSGGGAGPGGRDFYGCSLDPPAMNGPLWNETLQKFGSGPRGQLVTELNKVLLAQDVKLFGVPEDSRVALTMLAADFRLKRMSMGVEPVPGGVGNAMGSQEAQVRLWFEPSYDPLLVSEDGNSYEFRGPRLKVMVGAQVFVAGGAGPVQMRFAANFSAKMNEVAGKIDAVADLQNVTDCFMVAALVRQDRLAEKVGADWAWIQDGRKYPVQTLPVPKTAQTLVHINGNVIAQGGVAMALKAFSGVERSGLAKDLAKGGKVEVFAASRQRPEAEWFLAVKK